MAVVIETTIGDITVDLFIKQRPRACLNFLKLCKLKYYNYNLFHHVERNFIAQTGDPSGVGDGGESVWGVVEGPSKRFFEAESLPKIRHSMPGLISFVGTGKNMSGSQFFFTLAEDLSSLDGIHCVFGEVTEGIEVIRKLNAAIVNEKFQPFQDIRITHTVILEDPFEDPRGFRIPSRSPSPSLERLKNGKIGADEEINDTEGKSFEEISEMLAAREAQAQATILEIVGDLPSVDVAPPENVLFVCKLNPVTNDDDLEIIFSRFGKIVGCEVIRDKQTGDSLQYAFVEFEDKKSCEAAYFKMDNVLIDDRRIHVDFSQSVAKVQWRGKGRGLIYKDENKDRKLDFNNYRENRFNYKNHRSDKKLQSPNRHSHLKARENRRKSPYRANRNRSPFRTRRRTPPRKNRSRSPHKRFNDERREDLKNRRPMGRGNVSKDYQKTRKNEKSSSPLRRFERSRSTSQKREKIFKSKSQKARFDTSMECTRKSKFEEKSRDNSRKRKEPEKKQKSKYKKKSSSSSSDFSSSSDSSSSCSRKKKVKKYKKHKNSSSKMSSSTD